MKTETTKSVYDAESIPEIAKQEIDQLLESGDLFRYTSENSPVSLLEKDFAELMGTKYALAVCSCSAALHLSLEALNIPAGSRIIIPAFTFSAVPSSVINANMHPVLVEVGENYRIDLKDFESKIDQNIAAVLISHMRGHTSDMDAIMKICKERNIPVIEDAAHSLGTLWHDKKIGTIGKVGCFSFQSYKMINAGEGGILISNDPELIARAVIMSGAYEHNWKKHKGQSEQDDAKLENAFKKWQDRLPLYNLRMQNVSAVIVKSQLPELDRRVANGLHNHDYVAQQLNQSRWINVPDPLPPETRAPDSIQFNLVGFESDTEVLEFQSFANELGLKIQVFGMSENNARAFWNWNYIPGETPELPNTKKMLMRACDVRLPARLTKIELDTIIDQILQSINKIKN